MRRLGSNNRALNYNIRTKNVKKVETYCMF